MRVVIDTNVVVSGVFWAGAPREVLRLAVHRRAQAFASMAIMEEYAEVLHRLALRLGRNDWAEH